ncbi:MAG: hypothetical protein M3033_04040 [Acidobacteriota bacterium]|nr:hypothetical protein [Acidobacteriota bacterium]
MKKNSFAGLPFLFWLYLSLCLCVSVSNLSCKSNPTDLRTLAPDDSIVYLETNDLRKTLESITDNQAFQELAKEKTNFSALENVQFAVAITGFETSEKEISNEQSDLNFKPRFVAIADTHAWKPNAVSIAETEVGKFARAAYGDDVKLEKSEKADAKFFVWSSAAGEHRIFAAVSHSIIYVGNDESLIDKCLAVKRGEAENLLKNENLARARDVEKGENQIAFGYISPEGIAEIANLAGVSTAARASDNEDERNFIARILPQILKKTTREISWTASKTGNGIEDKIFISTNAEVSSFLRETLQTLPQTQTNLAEFLPSDVFSATRYSLQNPQTAWRGLLTAGANQTDAGSGKILAQFSGSLLEPYGISDADAFLGAIDSDILTAQLDGEGEKSVAVFNVRNAENVKKSIAEINFKPKPVKLGNTEIWKSDNGKIVAAFVENKLILGDGESVSKCLQAKQNGQNFAGNQYFQRFDASRAVAVTFAKNIDEAKNVVDVLSETKDEDKRITTVSLIETRFTEKGIERRSASAFGLIGTILEQLQ